MELTKALASLNHIIRLGRLSPFLIRASATRIACLNHIIRLGRLSLRFPAPSTARTHVSITSSGWVG